jgi:transcription elongation GreA/GreB family factor
MTQMNNANPSPPKHFNKAALFQEISKRLEEELSIIMQAAKAAHEAATHEESRAEDSHDTRGLESSYLAGAQALRAAEIQQIIHYYKQVEPRTFEKEEQIAVIALIELESGKKKTSYLLAPHAGGMKVNLDGRSIQIITPQSPVGEELMGKRLGDAVEVEIHGVTREYLITDLC